MQAHSTQPKHATHGLTGNRQHLRVVAAAPPTFDEIHRKVLSDTPLLRNLQPTLWEDGDLAGLLTLESIDYLEDLLRDFSCFLTAIARCNLIGDSDGIPREKMVEATMRNVMEHGSTIDFDRQRELIHQQIRKCANTMQRDLQVLHDTALPVVQYFWHGLRGLEERGIVGRYCQVAGVDAFSFRHGRTILSERVLSADRTTETISEFRRGLLVNRTIHNETERIQKHLETVLTQEEHHQCLWQPESLSITAPIKKPPRVDELLSTIPNLCKPISRIHVAAKYGHSMESTELTRRTTEHVETRRSQRFDRGLNWRHVGIAAGVIGMVASAPILLYSAAAYSVAATVDPCITVGDYVVAAWLPEEVSR